MADIGRFGPDALLGLGNLGIREKGKGKKERRKTIMVKLDRGKVG
jgi:hypothetical protein